MKCVSSFIHTGFISLENVPMQFFGIIDLIMGGGGGPLMILICYFGNYCVFHLVAVQIIFYLFVSNVLSLCSILEAG